MESSRRFRSISTRANNSPVLPAVVAALNAAVTAAGAFRFGFTHDDLMNFHWAMTRPWGSLCADVFRIWEVSPVYRPFAELLLKCGYSAFGMNLFAWRCFYGFLLCVMAACVAWAAFAVTGRGAAAAVAGVLAGYHPLLRHLYFSMGFIFDVTACILTCLFLIAYIRARSRPAWTWTLPGVLLVFALESKEIAVAALVLAAFYELVLTELPSSLALRRDYGNLHFVATAGPEIDGEREPGVSRDARAGKLRPSSRPLEL